MTASIHKFPDLRPLTVVELMDKIMEEEPDAMVAFTISASGGSSMWYTGGLRDDRILMLLERAKLDIVTGELSVEMDAEEPEE